MKIVGVDVGRVIGVAVLNMDGSRRPQLERACSRRVADLREPAQLRSAVAWVARAAAGADVVVMEAPLPGRHVSLVEAAELRGAILARLAATTRPIVRLAPATVKLLAAGHGHATKTQVAQALRARCGWTTANEHEADAAAMALAYAHRVGGILPPPPPLPVRRRRGGVVLSRDGAVAVLPLRQPPVVAVPVRLSRSEAP